MSVTHNFDLRRDKDFHLYSLDNVDCQYMSLVDAIRTDGTKESDPERTSDTWTMLPSAVLMLRNTAIAFPCLLSKNTNFRPALREHLWFCKGLTNINQLGSKIWDEWADEDGECGPIYGHMWRRWPDVKIMLTAERMTELNFTEAQTRRAQKEIDRMRLAGYDETVLPDGRVVFEGEIDQLQQALDAVRAKSRSRRIKVEAWNPGYIYQQALPPCHTGFEFNVTKATRYERMAMEATGQQSFPDTLHITASMRSNDVLLGRPFNIMGYTLMLHMFAKMSDCNIGTMTLNTTNTHVYDHHWPALEEQRVHFDKLIDHVRSTGQPMEYPLLWIDPEVRNMSFDEIEEHHFNLSGYVPGPTIKGRVTV